MHFIRHIKIIKFNQGQEIQDLLVEVAKASKYLGKFNKGHKASGYFTKTLKATNKGSDKILKKLKLLYRRKRVIHRRGFN